jgi:hypothetical protein
VDFRPYAAPAACLGVALTLSLGCGGRAPRARVESVRAATPSFADAAYYATGRGPRALAIGDLNGDGTPDVAIANYAAHTVSVLANRGDGRFRGKRDYVTGRHPSSVAISDLNSDGTLDLATANEEGSVSVLFNRGNGNFQTRRNYATPGSFSVAMNDLNGDGKPDLATANGRSVSVLLNEGNGSLRTRRDYPTPPASSIAIGDLNGDGKPDLVTDSVSVLLNRGDGTFPNRRDYAIPSSQSIAIGDLNGDGKLDLATASIPDSMTVSVLLNRGDGSLGGRRIYGFPPGSSPDSVAIGDLNGDGASEVVTADGLYGAVWVLVNRGDGNFGPHDYRNLHDYGTLPPGSPSPGPASIAFGDVNGDRRVDVAATSYDHGEVSVLLNLRGSREREN